MPERGVGRGGPRAWAVVATAVTGLSGFLTLMVAARALAPAEYADFLAMWSLLFGLFMVLAGVGLHTAASVAPAQARTRLRVLPLALFASLPLAVAGAVLGWLVSDWFVLPAWTPPVVFALAAGGYVVQTTLIGAAAGTARWRAYSITISVEGAARLVLVVVVAVFAGSLTALVLAVAAASLSWVLLFCLGEVRAAWKDASTTEGITAFVRGSAQTLVGSMGPAILIVGYPALVKYLASPELFAQAAGVLLAVLLTRAPFLVPLAVVQPAVVSRARRRPDLVPKFVAVVLAVGLLAAIVAAAAGPAMLSILGEQYRVNGWVVALLMVDASVLAAMMLVAALRLAQGRRRRYVLGWGVAVFVAGAFLLAPMTLDLRIVLGLLAAPLTGGLVLLMPRRGEVASSSSPPAAWRAPPVAD